MPTPRRDMRRFGGETACVEYMAAGTRLILDEGSGIRGLSNALQAEQRQTGRPQAYHVLVTHPHTDHVEGGVRFARAFRPPHTAHHHGLEEHQLREAFAKQFSPPAFPLAIEQWGPSHQFHAHRAGETFELASEHGAAVRIGVSTGNHPGGAAHYRLTDPQGRAVVYATDHEIGDSTDVFAKTVATWQGATLVIADAQYTDAQYRGAVDGIPRQGWGHSTVEQVAKAARAADPSGKLVLVLFHFDHFEGTDKVVRGMVATARQIYPTTYAAREGASFLLGAR
jgi:phosphoribosyl 1,2-cyclic phosphodiesterase